MPPNDIKTYQVSILQPAIDKETPVVCNLVAERMNHQTRLFHLDVNSVNCGENICEVVVVRMFWDELGRYISIDLEEGDELEKKEGIRFTKEDYKKLEEVLHNKNSELKTVFKDDLVTGDFVAHGDINVDAISGATSTVSPNETVEGAVWTCYTLWHWANGEIVSKIREITTNELSVAQLREAYLTNNDADYKVFAIEALLEKKAYDSVAFKAIKEQAVTGDYKVFKTALVYVENASKNNYYDGIKYLFDNGDFKKRVACLNSISQTNKGENTAYYNTLSRELSGFTYQEVEMVLSIFQRNNFISPVLLEELVDLLTSDDFLIARRAYWFLSYQEKELTRKQKKSIKKFKKKYSQRL
ncbi:hypothetical protein AXE80_08065 [Wenyingzhuangia fucanilytica]|uniref:Uncharacterized protein n=2 Tax=Wenyingzhuangia fucanilytica TaxID=1790137 RepID=A0A1B1Y639_9FLAO|nr:hypothetical protein AXE80_08065 [Wenyingzhuangia fucanilytica]